MANFNSLANIDEWWLPVLIGFLAVGAVMAAAGRRPRSGRPPFPGVIGAVRRIGQERRARPKARKPGRRRK